MLSSSSSNRSPAASRTQPIFSRGGLDRHRCRIARADRQDARREADDLRLAAGERQRPAAAATDQERRVRPLDGLRVGVVVGDRVVLAGEAERPVGEAALQDRRSPPPGVPGAPAWGRTGCRSPRIRGDSSRRRWRRPGARSTSTSRVARSCASTAGWRRSLFSTNAATRSRLGGRGDRRHGGNRRQLGDEVVGDDEGVDPDRLGAARGLGQLATGGDRPRIGQESEGLHAGHCARPRGLRVPEASVAGGARCGQVRSGAVRRSCVGQP